MQGRCAREVQIHGATVHSLLHVTVLAALQSKGSVCWAQKERLGVGGHGFQCGESMGDRAQGFEFFRLEVASLGCRVSTHSRTGSTDGMQPQAAWASAAASQGAAAGT